MYKRQVKILVDKEHPEQNTQFDPTRKGITRFSTLALEEQQRYVRENPDYGEIICRCEKITKAEIMQAIHNPLGADTLTSVKYRTCLLYTSGTCWIRNELANGEMYMEELLRIEDVYVKFKTERATVHALNGISLKIHKGESLGLVGETGAGKTTTALAILKLLADTADFQGNITYKGIDVYKMKEHELLDMRGGKISMIFQNPLTALNPVFSVGEQIAMVLRTHKGMNKREAMLRAGELLELVRCV